MVYSELEDDDLCERLTKIAEEIQEQQDQLDDLYQARADLIVEAVDDGMSYREIAAELGITHTAVQKIFDDERPDRVKSAAKRAAQAVRFEEILGEEDPDFPRELLNELIEIRNAATPQEEPIPLLR
jgi:predicted transcriptional regulator